MSHGLLMPERNCTEVFAADEVEVTASSLALLTGAGATWRRASSTASPAARAPLSCYTGVDMQLTPASLAATL